MQGTSVPLVRGPGVEGAQAPLPHRGRRTCRLHADPSRRVTRPSPRARMHSTSGHEGPHGQVSEGRGDMSSRWLCPHQFQVRAAQTSWGRGLWSHPSPWGLSWVPPGGLFREGRGHQPRARREERLTQDPPIKGAPWAGTQVLVGNPSSPGGLHGACPSLPQPPSQPRGPGGTFTSG